MTITYEETRQCFLCLKRFARDYIEEHEKNCMEDNNEKEKNIDDDTPAHTNNYDRG